LHTQLVTHHSINLSDLDPDTTYHYYVASRDASGNEATSEDDTFTTLPPPDTIAPVISDVTVTDITETTASITWATDEPATSQVEYGTTSAYGLSSTLDTTLVTSHSVSLSGLSSGTTYHYKVKSKDASGNLAVSKDYTFTTASPSDTTPPVISGVSVSNITTSGATITWATDEPATSQVEYGTTSAYGLFSTLDTSLTTSHSVTLSGLQPNTAYHFRVNSKDGLGNEAVSGDNTLVTLADATPPVISAIAWSSISRSSATISWQTDEPATSQVEYGTTTAYGLLSPLDNTLVSSHSVTIELNSPTTWHFRVRSRDAAGNESVSGDVRFTTSKIVFDDFADNVIWIMSPDGSLQTQLTPWGNNDANPALSHDGTRIAFESNRTGTWEIYVMNVDGTNVTHLVSGKDPAWSWDDAKIAFSQSGMLCLINPDGTGFQQLPTSGASPCFSPDNREIVFVSGFWNIFKVNLQTLTITQLTNVSWASDPCWSPDGSTIIYTDRSVGLQYARVWAMNPDGTNKRPLTAPNWTGASAWSPDGTQIICEGAGGLTIMNADGSNAVLISTIAFIPGNPSWA
jgi:hypothetical protein